MKLYIICITVVLLSVLALVFGYFGFPPNAINDGAGYIIPGIRMATVGTLDSPIVWTGDEHAQGGPFLTFMPLFPIFLSFFILPGATVPIPTQVFLVIALINVFTIAISAWIFYRIATMKGKPLDWLATIIICASLFLIFRASWSFGGRPETLVRLFFTIGFALVLSVRKPWHLAGALGVLLGLVAATHPLAPIFFAALIGFVFVMRYDFWTSFTYLAFTALVGIATFVLAMQLSPYSIAATLTGIHQYGGTMLGAVSSGTILLGLLKSSYVVLFGALGALLLYFGIRLFVRSVKNKQIGSPFLMVVSALISLTYLLFTATSGRSYYIAPFLLIVLAAILYYAIHFKGSKVMSYALALLFALLVGVSLKNLVLFPYFLRDGMTLTAARTHVAEIIAQHPGAYLVLGGSRMWTLTDHYEKTIEGDPSLVPGVRKYLLLQEEGALPQLQQKMGLCALTDNFYVAKIPKIFGVTIDHVTPGYGFAAYDCHT